MKYKYNFKKGDVVKCVSMGASYLITGGLYEVVRDLETDYKEDLLQVKCLKTGLTKEAFVRRFEHVKTMDNHSETFRLAELESIERVIVNEISRFEKEIKAGLLYLHDRFLEYGEDAGVDWINADDIVNTYSYKKKLDTKLKEVQREIRSLRHNILMDMLL